MYNLKKKNLAQISIKISICLKKSVKLIEIKNKQQKGKKFKQNPV
jgi:hypothetical protein